MPINYQEILSSINDIADAAPQYQRALNERRTAARKLFGKTIDQDQLRDKIRKAVSLSRNLRCAVPTAESLNQAFPLPEDIAEREIIAADGSQVNPSRHLAVRYFLLNLAAIHFPADPGGTPEVWRQSELFSEINVDWKGINEDRVAYLRDVKERRVIGALVKEWRSGEGVITLTDGPLELWLRSGDGPQSGDAKENAMSDYLDSLVTLKDSGAIAAGYVDKPRAALVVEALEIERLKPGDLDEYFAQKKDYHQFEGITDGDLFGGILARPGDRSAVFELQFSEAGIYKKTSLDLALHFFYLNVGREVDKPVLARVEIPAWVAADPDKLAALQAALFSQCGLLGEVRYPYVLHRAHEEAVVTFEDREELDRLIIEEFARHGIPVGEVSNKQSAKNLPTVKRRYNLGKRKY
jgi:hypothetical protein